MASRWSHGVESHKEDLLIVNLPKYAEKFPYFRQPKVIGTFSLNDKRCYCPSSQQQQYICWPGQSVLLYGEDCPVNFDLCHNLRTAKRKVDSELDERLNNLLRWILMNQHKFQVAGKQEHIESLSTNFVCYRGLLTKLLSTPYEEREDWIICATKWRGTIYLCAFDTEEMKYEKAHRTQRQQDMASWGYKFEQYMTTGTPGGPADTSGPVVENEEFCCVLRTRLGQHSVAYGAEVDALDPDFKGDPSTMAGYIELKTSREVENARQKRTLHKFKMLKWWAQCFLVGIEKLVVGFRDDSGVVHRLHAYAVSDLPKSQNYWSPCVSMCFAEEFLHYVTTHVTDDDPRAIYRFDFRARQGEVTCTALGHDETHRILPKWYIEGMFQPPKG